MTREESTRLTQQIIKMRINGMNYQGIGDMFGVTKQAIQQRLSHRKLERRCRWCGILFPIITGDIFYCSAAHKSMSLNYERNLHRILDNINFTPDENGCHNWTGCKYPRGYGRIRYNGAPDYAHHVAWIIFRSPIPNGLQVLHHCDNPACCNPVHLWLGTHKDNMKDRDRKGRGYWGSEKHKTDLVAWQKSRQGNHPTAKLTIDQVIKIRQFNKQGYSRRTLARLYKVTPRNISRIIRRETWKYI